MFSLMPHQETAIDNLANGKVLYGGVGTGKSLTAIGYYIKHEAPKPIIIITTAKKRDSLEWEGEAAKFGLGRVAHSAPEIVDDGTYTKQELEALRTRYRGLSGQIRVDSWNNIGKYETIQECFFIFDEQRLVGTGSWVKSFYKIARNNNWIMLSATPGDTWLDYIPIFVANGLYKNATQFKREHVVYATYAKFPKVVRYTGTATLERYRNMLLVEMPYVMHTTREVSEVLCNYDQTLMDRVVKDRWHIYEERPLQDVGELFRVARKLSASDASRVEALGELLEKHKRIIVFYNFDYELDILRGFAGSVDVAEWNGHRKQPIPDSDSWLYLVQYTAGAEGWNCIKTDAMCFYSLTYSYKNFMQAQGRIDRLNTPYSKLYYYMLVSKSAIDSAVRRSLSEKKHFNERRWAVEVLGLTEDF